MQIEQDEQDEQPGPTVFRTEGGTVHVRRSDVPEIVSRIPFVDGGVGLARALARIVKGPVDPARIEYIPEDGLAVVGPRVSRGAWQSDPRTPFETYLVAGSDLGTDWLMQFGPCGVVGYCDDFRPERLGTMEEIVGPWIEQTRRHLILTGETPKQLAERLTADMLRWQLINATLSKRIVV